MKPFKFLGMRGPLSRIVLSGASAAGVPGKRVLVVDDDPLFLKAATMRLERAGCEVITAQEGADAIAAMGRNTVDTIVMDVHFPPDVANGGMGSWDGFRLLMWLRQLHGANRARFIIVSANDSPEIRSQARRAGATAFFQKPVPFKELLHAMTHPVATGFRGH